MTWERFIELSDRGMETICVAVCMCLWWPVALIGFIAERARKE